MVLDVVEDGSIRAVRIPTLLSGLCILFVSLGQSLGTEIVRVAKRLVNRLERVPAGHEDLGKAESVECNYRVVLEWDRGSTAPFQTP